MGPAPVFGEGLPDRFFERLRDLKEADLLITMGTSLQVQPFASLIDAVGPTCPRLLLNLERVGDIGVEEDLDDLLSGLSLSSGDGSRMASRFRENGFDFDGLALGRGEDKKHLIRDVFFQGKTDAGVRELSRICGWEEELVQLWEEAKRVKGGEEKREEKVSAKAEKPPSEAQAQATHEKVQEKAEETASAVAAAATDSDEAAGKAEASASADERKTKDDDAKDVGSRVDAKKADPKERI